MRSKSGWWKTGAASLAVRVTDVLATRDCFLEKSGQMVLPLRGEGFFIFVIDGELKTQQGSYSRHRSHPIPNRKKVKVLVDQSCLTLCNLMNCSPPGSSVHGILQARTLEWLPCLPPDGLPKPGIKCVAPLPPALAGRFFTI